MEIGKRRGKYNGYKEKEIIRIRVEIGNQPQERCPKIRRGSNKLKEFHRLIEGKHIDDTQKSPHNKKTIKPADKSYKCQQSNSCDPSCLIVCKYLCHEYFLGLNKNYYSTLWIRGD